MNYAKLQALVDMYQALGADAMYNAEIFASLMCDEQMIVQQEIDDLS
jgi:hypothetical protein